MARMIKYLIIPLLLIASIAFAGNVVTMFKTGAVECPASMTQVPTADDGGSYNDFTCSAGTDKYALVDDPVGTPDDDSTYISETTTGEQQHFSNKPTLTAGCTIASVAVHFRAKRTGNVDGTYCRGELFVNGTNYLGGDKTLTDSYAAYSQTWLTNPNTSAAWTIADIEGTGDNPLQHWGICARGTASGETVVVTQCYLQVNYD